MPKNQIIIEGARVHNLKNINVSIPREKLVVITGPSGSGKSSLAFDTIASTGQDKYLEGLSNYARLMLGHDSKAEVDRIEGLSPTISVSERNVRPSPRSTVGTITEVYDFLRILYAKIGIISCPRCQKIIDPAEFEAKKTAKTKKYKSINGKQSADFPQNKIFCAHCAETIDLGEITPALFSFNNPFGACRACTGLGVKLVPNPSLVIPNRNLTIAEGAIRPWITSFNHWKPYFEQLEQISRKYDFSINTPIKDLAPEALNIILYGENPAKPKERPDNNNFAGVLPSIETRYRETHSDFVKNELESFMIKIKCPECQGKRLKKEVLNIKVFDLSIWDICNLPINDLIEFLSAAVKNLPKNGASGGKNQDGLSKIALPLIKEIKSRLLLIEQVGLEYLTMERSSETLSSGELARLKLANHLGSRLSGILYVLDEPSIGLHPRDNAKLVKTLKELKDLGNSVIVVEHDKAFMQAADYIIDIGPGAGKHGGEVVAEGTIAKIKKSSGLTGQYLSGRKAIEIPKKHHPGSGKNIAVEGATEHNLKNIDVKIPLGKFVCLTGVSGSGKSTLTDDILGKALSKKFHRAGDEPGAHKKITGLENLSKVVKVDQSPIGRTPRSNPATYTGAFTHIREIFTATNEAKNNRYKIGHFSFNVKGGRCEACDGEGMKRIEMYFLPDIYTPCEACQGKRYNKNVLEIKFNGLNIADVLAMSIEEAKMFFREFPKIKQKLDVLVDVGLGYLELGQPANTLSGGESQRIKLATELARPFRTGKTLYILDEPTVGLHFDDVKKLLKVLNRLVEIGNTVLTVEHNLDVIKQADWIIDLGPEGGKKGGEIVAQGTPEQVAKVKNSYTGQFLKEMLK